MAALCQKSNRVCMFVFVCGVVMLTDEAAGVGCRYWHSDTPDISPAYTHPMRTHGVVTPLCKIPVDISSD